ncbi:hypothetical protein LZ32DRAFT_537258, partial [Colletotrichum eremochloae]
NPTATEPRDCSWITNAYFASTNTTLIFIPALNAAFTSEFYWSGSSPKPVMKETLHNSPCFDLYGAPTTVFASDQIVTEKRGSVGLGLSHWLVSCVQETIESVPHLRRSLYWEKSALL